ncbi:MAG: bacteriocin [Mangrovibacterium sp.]|jgi:bacteriocin-like protein
MKTLFANNNIFEAFEILTAQELNEVKGGIDRGRDGDMPVEP